MLYRFAHNTWTGSWWRDMRWDHAQLALGASLQARRGLADTIDRRSVEAGQSPRAGTTSQRSLIGMKSLLRMPV